MMCGSSALLGLGTPILDAAGVPISCRFVRFVCSGLKVQAQHFFPLPVAMLFNRRQEARHHVFGRTYLAHDDGFVRIIRSEYAGGAE